MRPPAGEAKAEGISIQPKLRGNTAHHEISVGKPDALSPVQRGLFVYSAVTRNVAKIIPDRERSLDTCDKGA